MFVMHIGSCTTEDEIKVWTDSKVATFSENGSTVANGQSYEQRGEAASVEEHKCSFVHRLGCPFKLKIQRYVDKVVISACDDLGHSHDMDADRSRTLNIKYAEVLQPFLDDPNRAVRAKKVWDMFEKAIGVQEVMGNFPPTTQNKRQVRLSIIHLPFRLSIHPSIHQSI